MQFSLGPGTEERPAYSLSVIDTSSFLQFLGDFMPTIHQ